MHERYGVWNPVYIRFRRWAEQNVWDAMLQTLVAPRLTDDWRHMIDSTTIWGQTTLFLEETSAKELKSQSIPHLKIDQLSDDLTFIKSPKDTGKTPFFRRRSQKTYKQF